MNTIDTKQLEEILPMVSRPGRYLGNEWNVVKKDLGKVDVKFALAFPDIYDVGMSYLGFRIIYGVLNNREDVACERVFAPWVDFEEKMRQEGIPLFSLESKAPIKDFDIIGFSLTYELNYTNVLNMLDLAGIPLRSKERSYEHVILRRPEPKAKEQPKDLKMDSSPPSAAQNYNHGRNGEFPLVIAGGPAAYNPYPMSEFIDAFVIGEGEEVVLEIIDVYKRVTSAPVLQKPSLGSWVTGSLGHPCYRKEDLLKELANIEGVYVPKFPKEVKKRVVNDLNAAFYPTKEIVPNIQTIHDRLTIEIMRGCPFSCKFCQAGSFYKPVRLRSPEKILELARAIYRNTGYDEISLLSLSSGSYPKIDSLILTLTDEFKDLGVGISLPSLRSEEILKGLPSLIAKVRKTGLTFAIEAGSVRLRRYLNKDIDIQKVVLACGEAFKLGWRLVKFYFMLGLPTESDRDLEGLSDFINKILSLSRNAQVSVSITAFVPKAHTAFENERMEGLDVLIEKQRFLKERFKKNKRVRLKFHDARLSFLEGRLSRPDAGLSEIIFKAWQKGARFDAWREHFNPDAWKT